VLNDLHRHADSINDRAAGAESPTIMISGPVLVVAVPAGASEAHLRLSKALRALAVLQFRSALIRVARVITVATRNWRGASSDGVTAAYVPEATEASPVLGQPTIVAQQARAFVPFSIELAKTGTACKMSLST
jgi:hypothetical protein